MLFQEERIREETQKEDRGAGKGVVRDQDLGPDRVPS